MAETTDGKLINRLDVIWFIIVVIMFGFLVIFVLFAIRTFSPQKGYFPESIIVNVVDAGGRNKELSTEGKLYLKEQLHTALMEVSEKAESAYNEKFATLLTILTIFGIAWPVIIGLLQFKFNERELDKIGKSVRKSRDAQKKAKMAMKELHKQQAIEYATFAELLYAMGIEACERSKTEVYALLDGQTEVPSPSDFFFVHTIKYRLLEAKTDLSRLNSNEIEKACKKISDKKDERFDNVLINCIESARQIKEDSDDINIRTKAEKIIRNLIETGRSRGACDEEGLSKATENSNPEDAK